MSWDLTEKEYQTALAMTPAERYDYTLRKVADWEEIWALTTEGEWVTGRDHMGRLAMPIWPHERFAADCAVGHWRLASPTAIGLGAWMNRHVKTFADAGTNIAVFDTQQGEALFLDASEHLADLEKELRRLQ